MPLIAIGIALLIMLAAIALLPLAIIQRYPRRHVATACARVAGGNQPRRPPDLGHPLPDRRSHHESVGAVRVSLHRRRPGLWLCAWSRRSRVDQMGALAARAVPHAESLARARHHPRGDRARTLRFLAGLAVMAIRHRWRVLDCRVRCSRRARRRRRRARLLPDVLAGRTQEAVAVSCDSKPARLKQA